jgi:hypothetical protein
LFKFFLKVWRVEDVYKKSLTFSIGFEACFGGDFCEIRLNWGDEHS